MDRRSFLKIGGSFLVLSACAPGSKKEEELDFPVELDSNRKVGHLARRAMLNPVARKIETEVVIVGGGIAGMAAASSLKSKEFMLFDLNKTLGGTSSAVQIGSNWYSQGAHYDLSYPSTYGKEGLELLERLGIVQWNGTQNRWDFADKKYLISEKQEERCYYNGKFQPSVLPNTQLKKDMLDLLEPYSGLFNLPSKPWSESLQVLDKINFNDYLRKYLPVDSAFMEAIDYQMLDDYGATSGQLSALAGIHYYKCRPYFQEPEPELFSPPEGNYYFINKMAENLHGENLKSGHLVTGIEPTKKGWKAQVWDVAREEKIEVDCRHLIYAGQKHLLKYLHGPSHEVFADVRYSPWVAVNFVLKKDLGSSPIWQNDFLSEDSRFLGFVNSRAQIQEGPQVLTAYFCFPDVYHYMVEEIGKNPRQIVSEALGHINTYYESKIDSFIEKAYVKLLGHAMPIPEPGYLTRDRSHNIPNISFAGVDSGRLPLMFDALDSGIQASKFS